MIYIFEEGGSKFLNTTVRALA